LNICDADIHEAADEVRVGGTLSVTEGLSGVGPPPTLTMSHDDCHRSSQLRRRNAIAHHLAHGAGPVPQLPPAEDQKERREKKTR